MTTDTALTRYSATNGALRNHLMGHGLPFGVSASKDGSASTLSGEIGIMLGSRA